MTSIANRIKELEKISDMPEQMHFIIIHRDLAMTEKEHEAVEKAALEEYQEQNGPIGENSQVVFIIDRFTA